MSFFYPPARVLKNGIFISIHTHHPSKRLKSVRYTKQ